MYFQIENTPERINKRHEELSKRDSPKEECPRLVLAPFSRSPQVVFDNVDIGTTCEKNLEIFNPTNLYQQIFLVKDLPPGLFINVPGKCFTIAPETTYCLTLQWTPLQPTAMREILRFSNEHRGRFDVAVVLKTSMNHLKRKGKKTSPGKITKSRKIRKPPVPVDRKKAEAIYTQAKVTKRESEYNYEHSRYKISNKENLPSGYSYDPSPKICPFESPFNVNFNTSEIFPNMRKKAGSTDRKIGSPVFNNILKTSNKLPGESNASDIFDNFTFTPLKTVPFKNEKLGVGPKVVLSLNSESDLDESFDVVKDKENATHSIICVASNQRPNKWLADNNLEIVDNIQAETPMLSNKKVPNTSSPKEWNSPNFSMNTELSRISDLSFLPQRCSTERKVNPKLNNDTYDLFEDVKISSDTYIKESPNALGQTPMNFVMEAKVPLYFMRDSKMCKQSLFKQYQHNDFSEQMSVQNENARQKIKTDIRSPPRSMTPPLQSIPEESVRINTTHTIDKSYGPMSTFTLNQTYDDNNKSYLSKTSWSKKAVRTESELWKIPASTKPIKRMKQSLTNNDTNRAIDSKNVSISRASDVYSQSLVYDPFSSATYFYDKDAVEKFESEFKKWLNYILTPPADLESNIDQTIDFGKAWIDNKNKEIPVAPTKEQVSNKYHNSHRLESLRKSARTFLSSPEIQNVLQKLYLQIDKKLIAIRNDRNLHLDIGLQKTIMELLLSYNPLWLRIGLEAIYGTVLPLRSNSDIDGLSFFIIQRMFKNPFLKNKNSKSNSAPNMLLPGYMEAIKKFTLRKFFTLVFFLDKSKEKKLISHDPCLFCRNAVCKESREMLILFTRDLIAGIGDITKHLRPLGYVVTHKQTYLDEFKFAVHNLALDIRDGVRLTKVMEIILMKNGLTNQLRTPAVSRLQKIHNVQVAMKALQDAKFELVGDITASDIADGHREKTLSFLWQLIHVFRAPLFVQAATVIQSWWRKKYEVIVQKRKEEALARCRLYYAATKIQYWWRTILYKRYLLWRLQLFTAAALTLQKHVRRWICQKKYRIQKDSVLKIENWYLSAKRINEAKIILNKLKLQREETKMKSAILIQSYCRCWLARRHYKETLSKVVLIQSLVRAFVSRTSYLKLKKSAIFIQHKYRNKLIMRQDMKRFLSQKKSAIVIQSYFRMIRKYKYYHRVKLAVRVIEERYVAIIKMRHERSKFLEKKKYAIILQTHIRAILARRKYVQQLNSIVNLQRRVKANILMKSEKSQYLRLRSATIVIQKKVRAYQIMNKVRKQYLNVQKSVILIQRYFRSYLLSKADRTFFISLKTSTVVVQRRYRANIAMRKQRSQFLVYKTAAICLQRRFRANCAMKKQIENYRKVHSAIVTIQRKFKAWKQMCAQQSKYLRIRAATVIIQNAYRSYIETKKQRCTFLQIRQAVILIQHWYRSCKRTKAIQSQFKLKKKSCLIIQTFYRAYCISKKQRNDFLKTIKSVLIIQRYYRYYVASRKIRQEFIKIKTSTVCIQRYYRSYLERRKQRQKYISIRNATVKIQNYYRQYMIAKQTKEQYDHLKLNTIYVQRKFRSLCLMKKERQKFLKLKIAVISVQEKYRAILAMRRERNKYLKLRSATALIQTKFRAYILMKQERQKYLTTLKLCITLQRYFRLTTLGKKQRAQFIKYKKYAVLIQEKYRALLAMKKQRSNYLAMKFAAVVLQRRFRACFLMIQYRSQYLKIRKACVTIQNYYRAYAKGRKQRTLYCALRSATILIQNRYRALNETKLIRNQYIRLKSAALIIQAWYRSIQRRDKLRAKFIRMRASAVVIQSAIRGCIARRRYLRIKFAIQIIQRRYRHYLLGKSEQKKYLKLRHLTTKLQAQVRCYITRKRFMKLRHAAIFIQAVYRFKKQKKMINKRKNQAAVCIQKNVRRFLILAWYKRYKHYLIFVQKTWKTKLLTRLYRIDFLQKRRFIIKLQAICRGYITRKKFESQKEELKKLKEQHKQHYAALMIQSMFRGYRVRKELPSNQNLLNIRSRRRNAITVTNQETLKEKHEIVMNALNSPNFSYHVVINVFKSLELLTEVSPTLYEKTAPIVVKKMEIYMVCNNRSVSSVELLKSGAAVLVNLVRYKYTGAIIYHRDRIPPIFQLMKNFINSEILFCKLATYLWLFSKYEHARQDICHFLNIPANLKIMLTIRENVIRLKKMKNIKKKTLSLDKSFSHPIVISKNIMPALEPDYGIKIKNKPRYFEDSQHAIECLFSTYNLTEK